MEDQRQKRTQKLKRGHSKRARSMGQFSPSQSEFRPRYFDTPPRPSPSHSISGASPRFQGLNGNQFRQKTESQGSQVEGYREQGGASQSRPPRKLCNNYGRYHLGACRFGTNSCYWCGTPGHKIRDCPKKRHG